MSGVRSAALVACVCAVSTRTVAAQQPPTFAADIAPLTLTRCAPCHRPGGVAPFSLVTYDDVRRRAEQIAVVTARRIMPPWKADPGNGPFIGQTPLSDAEIALIRRWVDAGAVEGDASRLPPTPHWIDGWQLGAPDVVVQPPAYTLYAAGPDVNRIFVVPIPVDGARFVRGVEFRPGNARVVHHANIRIDRTPASRALDEQDPAPGYDGLILRSAEYPDGHFLGWTPGQAPPLLPKGLAWRLDRGADLVIEVHMQPSGKEETVQPSVGFYFGVDPPERTPAMLRLGRQTIDIAPEESSYTIADSFTLPVDVEVQAVQPHAHYRAREIRGEAVLPTGETRPLIRIADWDFKWQHVFRYVTPFWLPKGTTITMRYTYDNSAANPRNPLRPPAHVLWGQRSTDEMGDLWIQVLTRTAQDLETLNRAFRPKVVREDIIGYEVTLRREPESVELHDDAALLYLEVGRASEAARHFAASAALRPASASTHFNLATALTMDNRVDEAIAEYRAALRLRPDYAQAHNNLGSVLLSRGDVDAAIEHFRSALATDPSHALAHNNLGSVLLRRGALDEADVHLRAALRIDPSYPEAYNNLGHLSAARGLDGDAAAQYRRAVQLRPDWGAALLDLSWLLSSSPSATVRNGGEAIQVAQRAVDITGRRDPAAFDALGAAYAEAGRFEEAVAACATALDLAPSGASADSIRNRQVLYRQRQPYRRAPR